MPTAQGQHFYIVNGARQFADFFGDLVS